MHPVVLQSISHNQYATVAECKLKSGGPVLACALGFVLELETPFDAEAHGSDDRLRAQFRFIIGMPGNAVLARPVVIKQHRVKFAAAQSFYSRADGQDMGAPGRWLQPHPGVAIAAAVISHPAL